MKKKVNKKEGWKPGEAMGKVTLLGFCTLKLFWGGLAGGLRWAFFCDSLVFCDGCRFEKVK